MRSVMLCQQVRDSFSPYLDGAVGGHMMLSIAAHLETCTACHAEFTALRDMQHSLAALGAVRAPADLGTRLRVAISHERVRATTGFWQRTLEFLSLRWNNSLRPLALQASAGFAGAILLVGSVVLLLGLVAVPEPVMANDEPLGALTNPHYVYSVERPRPITGGEATVIVEAMINSRGEVYDYDIVSGPRDSATRRQISSQLLESVFQPAQVFGSPTRGRVVMTFSGVSVRG